MTVSTADVLNTVSNMTVMEIVDLIKSMEEKFGVTAAAPVAMAAAAAPAAAVEEQTEFTVMLKGFAADKKVSIIKVVREITGLGLKEAKDLVESAPCAVKEAIAKADAADVKKKLEEAGAETEVK